MTDHGYYEELITAGLDGELSEDQARELRAHLETCERCRNFRAAMEAVHGLTDRDLPEPPARVKENVMAAVRAAAPEKKKGKIIDFPLRSLAVAAAAAVVLWAGVRVFSPKGSSGSAAPQMSMAAAGSADTAAAGDAGEIRTSETTEGSTDSAFDTYNGVMEAAPAAAPAPEERPEEEDGEEPRYVIYAGEEELLAVSASEVPEGLLTPAEACPAPDREPDWVVQADAPEGERLTWLLWEEDGAMVVLTPWGDAGYAVSAEDFHAILAGG